MIESFDALEAELEALRPRDVSPRLHRGVAERLAKRSSLRRRSLAWCAVVAGGIAASVTLAVLIWSGDAQIIRDRTMVADPENASIVAGDDRLPTLLAYEGALADSAGAFEALLDKHARTYSLSTGQDPWANLMMPYAFVPNSTGGQ
jgi:hypothetical protein